VAAIRLYVIPLSNPAATGAAMLAYKRVPHRVVRLPPAVHPLLVRLAGFRGSTVPALELDGRKVQGTLEISRALEELWPDPPLFPRDPESRARVEAAEAWGERDLQPVPRRIFRWVVLGDPRLRRWTAVEMMGSPAPRLTAALAKPLVRRLAALSDAVEPRVRADVQRLPELLDRVDALLGDGIIGGPAPNAADFQILASVRVLLEFENLTHLTAGRPSEEAARRLYPCWLGPIPRSGLLDQLSEGSEGIVASRR
jgi:glutathione S-transferase